MIDHPFFALICMYWIGYTLWWIISTWILNRRHSQPLHRIITFFLIFKSLHSLFTLASISLCQNTAFCYWDLAINSTYTISNTFLFAQLLLISKGFNIIKEFLTRSELTFLAMGMGVVYLGYSCYSIKKPNFVLILILIIFCALFSYFKFAMENIRQLIRKKMLFLAQGNNMMSRITSEKISLFKNFLKCTILLLVGKILYLIVKYLQIVGRIRIDVDVFVLADDFCEVLMVSVITVLVRARFRGYLYDVQSEQLEREMQPIVRFLRAQAPNGYQTEPLPNLPFLILTPKCKTEFSSKNFLIANPNK